MDANLDPDDLIERLESIREDPDHPGEPAARDLLNWLGWLRLRRLSLDDMSGEDGLTRVGLWWERIDRYVWADVDQAPELAAEALVDAIDADEHTALIDLLASEQRAWREWLAERGIERIEAGEGEHFQPGIIEPDGDVWVPTTVLGLDGTAAPVRPGKAGYRVDGLVRQPSRAAAYRYAPS